MAFFSKLYKYSCRRQMKNHIEHYTKSTKAFDECSICLERMICVPFLSRVIGINISRLSCGHCFHKHCLDLVKETSVYCPMCRKSFFDANEQRLLKGLQHHVLDYINQMKPDRVDVVLREALKNDDAKLVALLIERHDPSETLHHYISINDTKAVSSLITSKCINWHKTVNGKTLIDIAAETNDNVMYYIVASTHYKRLHTLR